MSGNNARIAAYYAGQPVTDLGDIDALPPPGVPGYYGPPATDLGEIDAPPVTDLGDIDARSPVSFNRESAPIRPVGAQLSQVGSPPPGRAVLGAPPSAPVPVTDLGEIGEPAPGPSFARGPAQPDTAPPPGASPEAARAAQALAYYGGAGGKPKSGGGAGGARGPAGPSEYEKGIKALRGTYDEDKAATQRGSDAEKARADLIAAGAADIARQKQDDQAIQQLEAANAAKHFEDYSAETQRQIDDVRAKRIEPNRAYADTGNAVLAAIGGALGGLYQGLNKMTSNPFIDQMNKNIDRDIAAQEADLRTQKEGIAERKGLLAEMRATYKDKALADLQARNLYYEGAKEELAAQAAQYDSPAIQSRADQAISAISREQAKLDINEAIRKAAAAQAAATAAEHRRQVDFENALKLQHAQNETLTAGAQAAKDLRAGNEKTDEQTAHLGAELSKPELVEAKKTIDDLKKKLINPQTGQIDGTRGIPGVGPGADARERLAPRPTGISALRPDDWIANAAAGLNDEERVGRLEWKRLAFAYRHAVTGAGGSDEEAKKIDDAFSGANTPAEQAAAVRIADAALAERESRIRAGAPREAVQKYDARLNAEREGRPQPVRREAVK